MKNWYPNVECTKVAFPNFTGEEEANFKLRSVLELIAKTRVTSLDELKDCLNHVRYNKIDDALFVKQLVNHQLITHCEVENRVDLTVRGYELFVSENAEAVDGMEPFPMPDYGKVFIQDVAGVLV